VKVLVGGFVLVGVCVSVGVCDDVAVVTDYWSEFAFGFAEDGSSAERFDSALDEGYCEGYYFYGDWVVVFA